MNTLRIAVLTLSAAAMASAATYRFNLAMDAKVDGQELKAGSYKVDVNNETAVIRGAGKTVETKVRTESVDRKYDSTSVRYSADGTKQKLEEVHVGGKNTKLIFEATKTANGGL